MDSTEVKFTLTNGLQLAGLSWGSHNPIKVLALHGWLDNAATYKNLAPLLAEHVHLVAVDFAGHGLSQHRPAGVRYHLLDNVDDVIQFADALGWDSFYLMGHSMGAGVSTYITAAFPERVTALVLLEGIGTHASAEDEAPGVLRRAVQDLERTPDIKKPVYPDLEVAIDARTRAVGVISREAAKILCERGTEAVSGGITWSSDPRLKMSSAMRLTEPLVDAFISKIECSVLFVGGEQGFVDKLPSIRHRLSLVKDLCQVELPGNHHLHLEPDTVDAVSKAIVDFLNSL